VQFDLHMKGDTRRAHNPRLVMEKAGAALPRVLRDEVKHVADRQSAGAIVLPFRPGADRTADKPAAEVNAGACGQVVGG
jgi:hypothetical protein